MLSFLRSPGGASRWRPSGSADTTGAIHKPSSNTNSDRPEMTAGSQSVKSISIEQGGGGGGWVPGISKSGPLMEPIPRGSRFAAIVQGAAERPELTASPSERSMPPASPGLESIRSRSGMSTPRVIDVTRNHASPEHGELRSPSGWSTPGAGPDILRSPGGWSTAGGDLQRTTSLQSLPGMDLLRTPSGRSTPNVDLSRASSMRSSPGPDQLARSGNSWLGSSTDPFRSGNFRSLTGSSTEPVRLANVRSGPSTEPIRSAKNVSISGGGGDRSGPIRTISIQPSPMVDRSDGLRTPTSRPAEIVRAHTEGFRMPASTGGRSGELQRTRSNMSTVSVDTDIEEPMTPSSRALLAREVAELALQHRRVPDGMRDLRSSFEKGQNAADSAYAKLRDDLFSKQSKGSRVGLQMLVTVTERLEELHRSSAPVRHEDVGEVWKGSQEALAHWTQRETDRQKEKAEIRRMASLFKQAHDDATKMVDEARVMAQDEISLAMEKVRRAEEVTKEVLESGNWSGTDQNQQAQMADLKRELVEARRIKMLHQPTMVSHLELQVTGLQKGLLEKAQEVIKLRRELEIIKNPKRRQPPFQLEGLEFLGSTLYIMPSAPEGQLPYPCEIQWYRILHDGRIDSILGATTTRYAPEPLDVYCRLRVTIKYSGRLEILDTSGPLDPSPGLEQFVDLMYKYGTAHFNAIVLEQNGEFTERRIPHVLEVSKDRMKLRKGKHTKVRDSYSSGMQLAGATGGGDTVAQAVVWQTKGKQILLQLESERERNAAILLSRRFGEEHIPQSTPADTDESSGAFGYSQSESGSVLA